MFAPLKVIDVSASGSYDDTKMFDLTDKFEKNERVEVAFALTQDTSAAGIALISVDKAGDHIELQGGSAQASFKTVVNAERKFWVKSPAGMVVKVICTAKKYVGGTVSG